MIATERLNLIPATPAHFAALGESEAALAALLGVSAAPEWLGFDAAREAMAQAGTYLDDHPEAAEWWTYWFVHTADAALIGLGGYKGAPAEGAVEIGYALAPGYRGQGLASEAARGLIGKAWREPAAIASSPTRSRSPMRPPRCWNGSASPIRARSSTPRMARSGGGRWQDPKPPTPRLATSSGQPQASRRPFTSPPIIAPQRPVVPPARQAARLETASPIHRGTDRSGPASPATPPRPRAPRASRA